MHGPPKTETWSDPSLLLLVLLRIGYVGAAMAVTHWLGPTGGILVLSLDAPGTIFRWPSLPTLVFALFGFKSITNYLTNDDIGNALATISSTIIPLFLLAFYPFYAFLVWTGAIVAIVYYL